MATHQTSNHRNKSSNSRNQTGAQTQRPAPEEIEEDESSSTFGAIGDMAEQASDYVSRGASQTQECIREHSGTSVALSLVAGFGIGLLVGRALAKPQEPRSRRYRVAAEGVGRRLVDRIEAMIPDALAEHFGK